MPKTYYSSNVTLNSFVRNSPYTPSVQTYIALFTVSPTISGGGTEVAGNGYARQPVTFTAPVNGLCSNTADMVFPADVFADWGNVVSFGIYDGVTGGNLLYFSNLSASRYVAVNDVVRLPAGQVICQET